MVAIDYRQLALSWHPDNQRDHTFNVIVLVTVAAFLWLGLVMSWITPPKVERAERPPVPERVARFVMERPKPKPKPEVKPPAPPPKTEMRIQRPKPVERKPLTKAEEKARKSAEGSGLAALAKELAALADSSSVNTMVAKKLNTAPASTAAATVDTRILTSDTGRKSIGVRPNAHVATVGTTRLEDGQRQVAQGLLAANVEKSAGKGPVAGASAGSQGANPRRFEDVAVVMDQNKGTLYSIYNRTRRTNPGIKGKIVLIITILPTGQVSNIVVKSSELNAPQLEASLVARVKQFDFGKRPGGTLTVTIPVEFLPS
jgi:TonB family protein